MITIRLSKGANDDLEQAYWFYERQEPGLGDYFRSCLDADIEGLRITAGIHRQTFKDYHRLISRIFPYAITTLYLTKRLLFGPSSIAGEIPNGYANISNERVQSSFLRLGV